MSYHTDTSSASTINFARVELVQRLSHVLALTFLFMLQGCSGETTYVDVSHKTKYRDVVGSRYEVIGQIDAYGIRRHSKAPVEYITLIARPGIAGPEVGFEAPVVKGSIIKAVKVFQTNRVFLESGITLEVELSGTELPVIATILLDLNRGSEGPGVAELNSAIYRRL